MWDYIENDTSFKIILSNISKQRNKTNKEKGKLKYWLCK